MPRREGYKKRTALEKQDDATHALRLHRQKYSYREIAEIQKRSLEAVRLDIKAATDKFAELNQEFINTEILNSLAVLDMVEKEAWEAWYDTLSDAEKTRKELRLPTKKEIEDGTYKKRAQVLIKQIKDLKGQCGDPRLLKIIMECQRIRLTLMTSLNLKGETNDLLTKLAKAIGVLPKDDAV